MKTRITELLGIEHPVLCPGMTYVANADLVAAVSNAGGLGILAVGQLGPEETRAEIRRTRSLTQKPFGVGVALLMPGAHANAEVAIEERVPVLNFSLGKGDWNTIAAEYRRYAEARGYAVTLRDKNTYEMLGCLVYRDNKTPQFSWVPKINGFDECHIDKSGRWPGDVVMISCFRCIFASFRLAKARRAAPVSSSP